MFLPLAKELAEMDEPQTSAPAKHVSEKKDTGEGTQKKRKRATPSKKKGKEGEKEKEKEKETAMSTEGAEPPSSAPTPITEANGR